MNLIEQLGGYEKAKTKRDDLNHTLENCEFLGGGDAREGLYERLESVEQALLKYRRQHNIFEVGDRFVIDGLFGVFYANDGNIPYLDYNKIRHATDAEIKAGKRLEVNDGN